MDSSPQRTGGDLLPVAGSMILLPIFTSKPWNHRFMNASSLVANMKDYRKLMAVGGVILVLPFIRPFLAFASKHGFFISSIGFAAVLLGLILMITEKN